jgi:molybdopterin molybdotransferase
METLSERQRIPRLTPLAAVLERVAALVRPVEPHGVRTDRARGLLLGRDVMLRAAWPAHAVALRDGWAVRSGDLGDASAYAPVQLQEAPRFVETGDTLPYGTDTVLPPDAVNVAGEAAEALVNAAPGEGVLARGADVEARTPLRRSGERLREVDVTLLRAANIERVSVREPRVLIVTAADIVETRDIVGTFVQRVVQDAGGGVRHEWTQAKEERLARLLTDKTADAIIVIGGTGEGPRDVSVRTLARVGRVDVHGIALRPGETAALGAVGARPVLLLPGRLDAALSVWLTLGTRLLARLTGASEMQPSRTATLARKVSSPIGLAEVVPVAACEGGVEPLASGYFPLQALARAEGWILVPPDSEGYPAGACVEVMPFP